MTPEMRVTLAAVFGSWVLVCATIWSVWDQHKNATEFLSVQIAFELDKQWDSPEMHRARQKLVTVLLKKQPVVDYTVPDFFEKVALYANKGDVDEETIYNAFSDMVEYYWLATQGAIKATREDKGGRDYYDAFEALYKTVLAQEAKKTGKSEGAPSAQDIQDFLREEQDRTAD